MKSKVILIHNPIKEIKLNEELTIGQEDVGEIPAEPEPGEATQPMEPGDLPTEPGDLPEEPPAGVPPPDTSLPEENGDEEGQPTEPGEE